MDVMLWECQILNNGTAVVMQFANMLDVEQYLYALSDALHSNSFEIVPVQFTEFLNKSSTKNAQSARLLKNREFQKAKQSKESDCDRQNRLLQKREYMNKKRREESELARQTRIDGAKMYQKGSDQLRLILREKISLKIRGFIEEVK